MRAPSSIFGAVVVVTALTAAGAWLGCGSFGSAADPPAVGDGGGGGEGGGGDSAVDGQPPGTTTASFCDDAGPAKRCLDFDRPAQIATPFGFDQIFKDEGTQPIGTLSVDGITSRSAPNNLHVETLGGGSAQADIILDSAGTFPAHVRVSFQFRYDLYNQGTSSSSHFLELRCRNKDANRVYLKLEGAGKLGLKQDPSAGLDPTPAPGFTGGEWHHIAIVFDWGTAPKVDVTLDGVTPFGTNLPLQAFSCGEPLVLRFGSWVSTGIGDYGLRFDDILVDWN